MTDWVLLVIALCSVVQSVFGMGILVFGTPTLLLMGLSFPETLSYVLPASIVLSVLQVLGGPRPRPAIGVDLWLYALPMIGAGLVLSIVGIGETGIKQIVGLILIVSVAVIIPQRTRALLISAVRRHSRAYHAVMGFVHGLSNMGGSLLSIYAAATADGKEQTRYVVAFYYLLFGLCQVATLLIAGEMPLSGNLWTITVSVGIYLLLGNRVFKNTPERTYKPLFVGFMAAYGIALVMA